MSSDGFDRRVVWLLLLLAVLGYFLFFHAVGRRHLWSPDEDEYTLVNREMVTDGHWIYPTVNGKPYSIKPPLYNWLGSGISLIYGEVSELSSRLPSAIFGLIGVFVVYVLGRRMFGGRAGFLAACVIASTPLYIEFSRWIQINMVSAVLLTLTLLCFWWGYSTPRRRTPAYLLMYVPIGVGTLNMGLVNVAMPAIVIGVFLIVVKDLRHILALKLHWGILIFLAVAGPWYATVCQIDKYRDELLIVTNFERFFSSSFAHTRPFWYYLTTTPGYFLPWTLFLPSAVIALRTPEGETDRKPLLFTMGWVAALFVFFSLSKTKRSEYLLPIFPAMALLVGYVIDRGLARGAHSGTWWKLVHWPMRTTVGLLFLGGIGAAVVASTAEEIGWFFVIFPISLLAIAGASAAGLLFQRGRGVAAVLAIVTVFAGSVAWASVAVVDRLNVEKSVVSFCENVAGRFPEGSTVRQFHYASHAYGYYLRRTVRRNRKPEVLAGWLKSPERTYVIFKEDTYKDFRETLPVPTYVVHRQWVDHRYIVLVSNQPD